MVRHLVTGRVLPLAVAAALVSVASAAAGNVCTARKLVAAGHYVQAQVQCTAAVARASRPVDPQCSSRARSRFFAAWARAESFPDCETIGDRSAIQAAADAFVARLADSLMPGTPTSTTTTTRTTSTTIVLPPGVARYTFTGGLQTFQVPPGVTSIVVKAWGAGGGGRCGWGGGAGSHGGGGGGFAQARIAVVSGEQLTVVGGGGGGGFSWDIGSRGGFGGGGDGGSSTWAGFGGGGRSEVSRGSQSLVVAGGGGGAGDRCSGAGYGGGGGGGSGAPGEGGTPTPGTGGSNVAGGMVGTGGSGGTSGTRGQGGHGCGGGDGGGGGGGGGYFGGGGGGAGAWIGAGGGGGSSFVTGTDQLLVPGDQWLAGNATDADYVAPLGEGGQYDGPQEGQPGLIIIRY